MTAKDRPASETRAADTPATTSPPSARFITTLGLLLLALAGLLYAPTLGNAYAYDDVDYLNQAAAAMAGQRGFWATMFRPQGEHLIMGMRLVLHASASLFGADATPFRLFVLLTHAGAGLLLALVALRATGSRAAATATGIAYVGACGFSSMWIWFPSGGSVPFGMLFLAGSLAALVHRDLLGARRARLLAGAGVLLALFCESTLAPLAAMPMLVDEAERRRDGARGPVGLFSLFCVAAAAAAALGASVLYTRTFGPRLSISLVHGVPRALFLLFVAPFRLFFPGLPVLASEPGAKTAILGSLLGLSVAAPVAALLLALWRRGAPRLALLAALTAVGPLGVLGLVGLGRWRTTYWELYDADRYFFTLLVPLSLLAGAVAASVAAALSAWPRRLTAALLLLVAAGLGAELVLHRRAMLRRVPFDVYAAHEARYQSLERLAAGLERTARDLPPGSPPLEVPDTALWFPEIHNGHLTTAFLLHISGRVESDRLRLGGPRVDERNAAVLNRVLTAWARETGEELPYLSIVDGRLVNARVVALADFRTGPQALAVVSGFYDWEGSSRWMDERGELLLTLTSPGLAFHLAVPMASLQAAHPDWESLPVRVSVADDATGFTVPLGTIEVAGEGVQLYRLDATPFMARFGAGRTVRLILECDRVWRPVDVLPGALDARRLTVQVFAAGVESPAG